MSIYFKAILSILSGRLLLFQKITLIVVIQESFSVIIVLAMLFAFLYQKAILIMKDTRLYSSLSIVY